MYIHIEEETECSKCGKKNYTEQVTRGMETFIRCRKCGHEKLTSTLIVSAPVGGYTYYDLKDRGPFMF